MDPSNLRLNLEVKSKHFYFFCMFIIALHDQSSNNVQTLGGEENREPENSGVLELANYSVYNKTLEYTTKVLKEQEEIIAKERAKQAEKDAIIKELQKKNELLKLKSLEVQNNMAKNKVENILAHSTPINPRIISRTIMPPNKQTITNTNNSQQNINKNMLG